MNKLDIVLRAVHSSSINLELWFEYDCRYPVHPEKLVGTVTWK